MDNKEFSRNLEKRTRLFAFRARSKADFTNKIRICGNESSETVFWLEVIQDQAPGNPLTLVTLVTLAHFSHFFVNQATFLKFTRLYRNLI